MKTGIPMFGGEPMINFHDTRTPHNSRYDLWLNAVKLHQHTFKALPAVQIRTGRRRKKR